MHKDLLLILCRVHNNAKFAPQQSWAARQTKPKSPQVGAGLLIRLLFRGGESLGLVEDVIHLHVKAVSLLGFA